MKRKNVRKDTITQSSVYDMTTRELRKEIRKRTAEINVRIMEYQEAVKQKIKKASKIVERGIERLKEASAFEKVVRNKKTGETKHTGIYYVPKGKKGEIGLGLSYKSKAELQKQLAGLRRFETKDIETPQGQKEWSEKTEKQYETFRKRYRDISKEEYEEMIDTMNIVKNTIKDYGYEEFGGGYARAYVNANRQGRRKFAKYVEQAKRESSGKTTEDVLDRVNELLRENGEI